MSQFNKYLEIVQEGKDYSYNEAFDKNYYKEKLKSLIPNDMRSELEINDEWSIKANAKNYKNSTGMGGFSLYSDDEGRRNLYWDDLTLKTALDTIEKILSGKEIE